MYVIKLNPLIIPPTSITEFILHLLAVSKHPLNLWYFFYLNGQSHISFKQRMNSCAVNLSEPIEGRSRKRERAIFVKERKK